MNVSSIHEVYKAICKNAQLPIRCPGEKGKGQQKHGGEKWIKEEILGASLVAQWLRVCLPMQGTRVRALVREDPHAAEQLGPCATTTEPACLEPVSHNC